MTTALELAPRPSSPAEEELSLADFLDLFGSEEAPAGPERPSLRASGARLRDWTQQASRRAARWGAVAGSAGTGVAQ